MTRNVSIGAGGAELAVGVAQVHLSLLGRRADVRLESLHQGAVDGVEPVDGCLVGRLAKSVRTYVSRSTP